MSAEIAELLQNHWALNPTAADVLAGRIPTSGHDHLYSIVDSLSPEAIAARNESRVELGNIISGISDKMWLTFGPCSTDRGVSYEPLHDLRDEVQEAHPDWFVDERLNGDKPRSGKGWKGLLNSTDPEDRRWALRVMHEAAMRLVPVESEIADPNNIGSVAPYSTSVWSGARDLTGGAVRGALAIVSGMPVAAKNGLDGKISYVEDALGTIGGWSTTFNQGSGINLGSFASTADHLGFPTGILPVEHGNPHVAIIGRGYELSRLTTPDERAALAFEHISGLCDLAAARGSVVKLDIDHKQPKMLNLEKVGSEERPFSVLEAITAGIKNGQISNADRIRGFMCEIGPVEGRTDPNWIISKGTADRLGEMMMMLSEAVKEAT